MYKNFFKRFLDFWISLIVLIIISPILLVITIWSHFANKGAGAFSFQERPGKDGKIFKVIKYKTMTDERDAEGNLMTDLKVIFITIKNVLMRKDINSATAATMEAFNGHN